MVGALSGTLYYGSFERGRYIIPCLPHVSVDSLSFYEVRCHITLGTKSIHLHICLSALALFYAASNFASAKRRPTAHRIRYICVMRRLLAGGFGESVSFRPRG